MSHHRDGDISIVLFSALYPHEGEPTLGIFVENRLKHLLKDEKVNAVVIAPVPWFPLKHKTFGRYGRSARAPYREERSGITVYHPRYLVIPKVGMLLTPFFLASAGMRVLKKLIRAGTKVDLIDAHYLYPDGIAASYISGRINIPFVMTARGSDVTEIALMPRPKQMILGAINLASHVITVSQSLKDRLVSFGADKNNITPLRNGVDLIAHHFQPDAREALSAELGFDPNVPVIAFAGWFIDRKRVDIIIEVISRHDTAVAILIGDGPLHAALRKQAKDLGVAHRIFFVGQQKPAAIPFYFSAADVLMLPSEREGWANVLLEAMACGTPVIARAVDGACELIRAPEAGRLVEKNKGAADYLAALNALLNDRPSRKAVRAYAERFDWTATSRGQYEIFRTAIDNHHDNFSER